MPEPPGPRWVLILRDPRAMEESAGMAAAAVSLGVEVVLVWMGEALARLAAGDLDGEGELAAAGRLLSEAAETGRLRALACSAASVRGASADLVRAHVDEIVGWPTVVSLIRASERSFVW